MPYKKNNLISKFIRLINEEQQPVSYNSKFIINAVLIKTAIIGYGMLCITFFIGLGNLLLILGMDDFGKRAKFAFFIGNFPFILVFSAVLLLSGSFIILRIRHFNFQKFSTAIKILAVIIFITSGMIVFVGKLYKDPSKVSPKKLIDKIENAEIQNEVRDDFWTSLNLKMEKLREKTK